LQLSWLATLVLAWVVARETPKRLVALKAAIEQRGLLAAKR
jgi:hypothetical protein